MKEHYELTRRGFIDAVWNRICEIEFRPTYWRGTVFPMKGQKDRFGRTQVYMNINPEYPPEMQEDTLVHECVHIDREAWNRKKGEFFYDSTMGVFRIEGEGERIEEKITDEATVIFLATYQPLVRKALNHIMLRAQRKIKK